MLSIIETKEFGRDINMQNGGQKSRQKLQACMDVSLKNNSP